MAPRCAGSGPAPRTTSRRRHPASKNRLRSGGAVNLRTGVHQWTNIKKLLSYGEIITLKYLPLQCPFVLGQGSVRSEEHTSELQSRLHLVCRLLLEKKKKKKKKTL